MTNSKHYLALFVSSFIFIVSLFAFGFIYHQVDAQSTATLAVYSQIAQAQAEQNQANSVLQTLSSSQGNRGLLQTFFVPDDQTVGFIKQVEAIGKESGSTVSIATISDDDLSSAAAGTTGSIHAHMDIKGSWSAAMDGLHLMENLPYGESIDNVRATPTSKDAWNIEFDLTVALIHA